MVLTQLLAVNCRHENLIHGVLRQLRFPWLTACAIFYRIFRISNGIVHGERTIVSFQAIMIQLTSPSIHSIPRNFPNILLNMNFAGRNLLKKFPCRMFAESAELIKNTIFSLLASISPAPPPRIQRARLNSLPNNSSGGACQFLSIFLLQYR